MTERGLSFKSSSGTREAPCVPASALRYPSGCEPTSWDRSNLCCYRWPELPLDELPDEPDELLPEELLSGLELLLPEEGLLLELPDEPP